MSYRVSVHLHLFSLHFLFSTFYFFISKRGKLICPSGVGKWSCSSVTIVLFQLNCLIFNSISIDMRVQCPNVWGSVSACISSAVLYPMSPSPCITVASSDVFVLCYSHFSSRFDPSSTDFESKMMALPKSEGSTDAKRPLANIHPSSSLSSFSIFHNDFARLTRT